MNKRVVFLGNGTSHYTTTIFRGFLNGFKANNVELVLNVDTVPGVPDHSPVIHTINKKLKKFFSSDDYVDYGHRHRPFYKFTQSVPLVQATDINKPAFLEYLSSFSPDYAILVGCPQIAGKGFLSMFGEVINLHASLLPRYRGLNPVSWAMYHSEPVTGCTFHYVTKDIDDGNILAQKEIPIDYQKRPSDVMKEIAKLAARSAPSVVRLLKTNYVGIPQTGKGSYFGKKAKVELLTRLDLSDYEEINRIITCFGFVNTRYRGEWVQVTSINRKGNIRRINHLPPLFYHFLRKVRSVFTDDNSTGSLVQYFQNIKAIFLPFL